MSFRNRLTLFFIVLVILPMIAVAAVVLFRARLGLRAGQGRRAARRGAALRAAACSARCRTAAERRRARSRSDQQLAEAIRDGRPRRRSRAALDAARRATAASAAASCGCDGRALRRRRRRRRSRPRAAGCSTRTGSAAGELDGLDRRARSEYAQLVERVTGARRRRQRRRRRRSPRTLPGRRAASACPAGASRDRRPRATASPASTAPASTGGRRPGRVLLAEPRSSGGLSGASIAGRRILLVGFLIARVRVRADGRRARCRPRSQRLLDAARAARRRRLRGRGADRGQRRVRRARHASSTRWRASSRSRLEELQLERERLQRGDPPRRRVVRQGPRPRRAARDRGPDRGRRRRRASGGRAAVRPAPDGPLRGGRGRGRRRAATARRSSAAEAAALDAGERRGDRPRRRTALAHPLRAPEGRTRVLGVLIASPATAAAFTAGERELFDYLADQAAVSIENVDLHETVQRQAVTDELTGLFNHRRFQEVMCRRGRARPALRPADGPDHARHRQLQARQRHLRPHAGRPRAARGGARAARVLARDRRARPLRRRGDGGRAARRPTSRAPTSSPSACATRIEALELPLLEGDGHAARHRVVRRRRAARLGRRRTRTRWSPRPTPRSTARSAPARTALCRPE